MQSLGFKGLTFLATRKNQVMKEKAWKEKPMENQKKDREKESVKGETDSDEKNRTVEEW